MKILEQTLKEVLIDFQASEKPSSDADCLAEETMALYLAGDLAGPEREQVMHHLALCPRCLDVVTLESSLAEKLPSEESPSMVPASALAKARALLKGAQTENEPLFDLVLRFCRGSLEVLKTTMAPPGLLAQPALAALRTDKTADERTSTRLEKSLGDLSAELEVAPAKKGLWDVTLFLRKAGESAAAEGVRVTLKELPLETELQSSLARGGLAVFEGLACGDYGLEIKKKGEPIGALALRLTQEG